ncbi:MAG TPA: hypothetical protein VK503_04500 [Candidatus Bathyarchaeia archaeon]|nr:hypothetical protein [Candidatus Bathyarchaeia archaeon]
MALWLTEVYKTFTINISNALQFLGEFSLDNEVKQIVRQRLDALRSRIENAPKSMKWRMRAKIGQKKHWYDLPEMDRKVVDSRVFGEKETAQ